MTTLRQAALAVIARWDLPHRHHQLSTTRIFEDLRKALEDHDIKALQAEGKGPAPCARFCESNAFEIEIRNAAGKSQVLQAKCDAFLANVQLLEVEIEAMAKERDALRVAGKLALEALEHVEWKNWRTDKAITALKQAGVSA